MRILTDTVIFNQNNGSMNNKNSYLFKLLTSPLLFKSMLFVSFFGWVLLSLYRFFFLEYHTWDTGAHVEPLIYLIKYGKYYNSFGGCPELANHFRPGLLVFIPFLKLIPNVLWIAFAKIFAFFSCPLLLYHYGKKYLPDPKWATLIPVFWLVSDVLNNSLFAENYATGLILPFIILAFFAAWEGKKLRMIIYLISILFFKENMALVWLCLGMFLIVEKKDYKWGSGLFISGIFIGLGIFLVLIPMLSSGVASVHSGRLAPLAMLDLKLMMSLKVILALFLAPLIYPPMILYVAPAFGLYFLSGIYQVFWLNFHYHDFTFTIALIGCFFALLRFQQNKTWFNQLSLKVRIRLGWVAVVLASLLFVSKLPYYELFKYPLSDLKRKFTLFQTVQHIRYSLPEDRDLWVPEKIGVHFMEHPRVKSIVYEGAIEPYFYQDKPFIIAMPKKSAYAGVKKITFNAINQKLNEELAKGNYRIFYEDNELRIVLFEP